MELHQKTLFEKRSFFLLPNKLKLYLKDAQGEYENYIPYEKLHSEAQIRTRKNYKLFFMTITATSFTVCILLQSLALRQGWSQVIIPIIVTIVCGILYQVKQESYVIIDTLDRKKVIFLRDQPNRQTLEKFLDQLWLKRKEYLREKYFYINHSQDLQQQTERLRWLLEQKAITKTEFKFAHEDWIIDKSY